MYGDDVIKVQLLNCICVLEAIRQKIQPNKSKLRTTMLELYAINNSNVYTLDSKGCYLNGSAYYFLV